MKVYVVAARWCEETEILGVVLDEGTAERYVKFFNEKEKPTGLDGAFYEEHDTNDLIKLMEVGETHFITPMQAFKEDMESIGYSWSLIRNITFTHKDVAGWWFSYELFPNPERKIWCVRTSKRIKE